MTIVKPANLKRLNRLKVIMVFVIPALIGLSCFSCSSQNTKAIASENKNDNSSQAAPKPEDIMKNIAGDDPFLGPENAPVVIVDFSDYFCPHCNELYFETMKKALKEYDGKIKFVARSAVMLSERSYDANKSAFCAREQGYFWEMHEILLHQLDQMIHMQKTMENYRKLQKLMSKYDNPYLTNLASGIDGLDKDKFSKCLSADPYREKIIEADQMFRQLGAQGAPFVIINGKAFSGSVPYSFLKQAIDDELKMVE